MVTMTRPPSDGRTWPKKTPREGRTTSCRENLVNDNELGLIPSVTMVTDGVVKPSGGGAAADAAEQVVVVDPEMPPLVGSEEPLGGGALDRKAGPGQAVHQVPAVDPVVLGVAE